MHVITLCAFLLLTSLIQQGMIWESLPSAINEDNCLCPPHPKKNRLIRDKQCVPQVFPTPGGEAQEMRFQEPETALMLWDGLLAPSGLEISPGAPESRL